MKDTVAKKHLFAFLLYAFSCLVTAYSPAQADVYVESTQPLIQQERSLPGASYFPYALTLERGSTIHADIQVVGGINNAIRVWLVDLTNFQALKNGAQFTYAAEASPYVVGRTQFSFRAPRTDIYYLVFDNRKAILKRTLSINVTERTVAPTLQSLELKTAYNRRYGELKRLFNFPDFNIYIGSCGVTNAFSTRDRDIVICSELIEDAKRRGEPAAEEFIFFHEAAHTLLGFWEYPGNENEDTADEFATVMLMLLNRENAALQAAQYASTSDISAELRQKLYVNDRHSLSIQRARNILTWLDNRADLGRRWLHLLIPNMTDEFLEQLARSANTGAANSNIPYPLIIAAREELQRRHKM